MRENRKNYVIAFRAAAVLLVLLMLSTCILAGRFARYASVAFGNDTAVVAKFWFTESGDIYTEVNVSLFPTDTVWKIFQVHNAGEVDKTQDDYVGKVDLIVLTSTATQID